MHQRRILCEYSDAKFKSPASLVSEIDAFVSCHYDVFCMFLHDILIDSSIFHRVPVGWNKNPSYSERRILCEYSDAIFTSPTSLVAEIYTFVSCHYDVFVCFCMIF